MTTAADLPPPRIASLATAVPPHRVPQEEVLDFFGRFFDPSLVARAALRDIYVNAEIESRYACAPVQWYEQDHSFEEKNDLYIKNAVRLLKQVAVESLAAAGVECSDIDMIVTVSTTGIAVPALDTRLMAELPFRRNVQRLPLFGLGCAGGTLGLARAAACARGRPGSRILYLVVELCTTTFCPRDRTVANVVSTALFGDGAAAAVLTADGTGPAVTAWGEHTWPDTLDVMGWNVTHRGLEVVLSKSVPDVARRHVRAATEEFLATVGLELADIDDFVAHPGGARVLDALETAFGLPRGGLAASRGILRDYGNMSAVTVLFILKRVLEARGAEERRGETGPLRRHLMTSLGPGFSIGFLVLESA